MADETKPEEKKPASTLAETFIKAERQAHTGIVMRLVAAIEYDLERSLLRKFRPLNARMTNRLFGAYGPISSFAAKIDMAYALGITTDEVNVELNKIRKIRNLFAHSKASVSLDTEPLKSIFYKLRRPPGITGSYLDQFVKCGIAVDDHLGAYLVSMGETEDLRALKKPTQEEPKKEETPTDPAAKPTP
jgi:hypothetical protein